MTPGRRGKPASWVPLAFFVCIGGFMLTGMLAKRVPFLGALSPVFWLGGIVVWVVGTIQQGAIGPTGGGTWVARKDAPKTFWAVLGTIAAVFGCFGFLFLARALR